MRQSLCKYTLILHVHVISSVSFFFFQAEDGIRDVAVTGVQTCALPICSPGKAAHARILVNDRLDVALAAHAGGVHLGEQSLPPEAALRLRQGLEQEDFLIGVSCHSPKAAKQAERGGAD